MITRRTWAAGPLLLLAGLALGLVLAGPAVASEPGPAYPPGAGADDVVQAGAGEQASGQDDGAGEQASGQDDGAGEQASGQDDGTEVDEPTTEERPDVPGPADDEADGEEAAADGDEVASDAAPEVDESRIGPILVVIGTAVLLGGAVVAIARRI